MGKKANKRSNSKTKVSGRRAKRRDRGRLKAEQSPETQPAAGFPKMFESAWFWGGGITFLIAGVPLFNSSRAVGVAFLLVGWLVLVLALLANRVFGSKFPRTWVFVDFGLALLIGVSFTYATYLTVPNAVETDSAGVLVPANDPMISDGCSTKIPDNAFRIYYGESTYYTTENTSPIPVAGSPFPLLSAGNTPVLSVERSEDGSLFLNAQVMDEQGKFIAKIERNAFRRNQNNSWYQERRDLSTLAVYDDHNREVLFVRYMNPKAIKIRGRFNYPGHHTMVLTDEAAFDPKSQSSIAGNCVGSFVGGVRF